MVAILGAISVITAVESLTYVMLFSMLYTSYQLLPEYVEKTTIMNFKRFITIYGYGYGMAAILDAILKMIAFPMWDFGGVLLCCLLYQVLSKSVEKTFCIIN